MELRKVIMNNGHEYELIWDGRYRDYRGVQNDIDDSILDNKNRLIMFDIKKGRTVNLNQSCISEIFSLGELKPEEIHDIRIRNILKKHYEEFK